MCSYHQAVPQSVRRLMTHTESRSSKCLSRPIFPQKNRTNSKRIQRTVETESPKNQVCEAIRRHEHASKLQVDDGRRALTWMGAARESETGTEAKGSSGSREREAFPTGAQGHRRRTTATSPPLAPETKRLPRFAILRRSFPFCCIFFSFFLIFL